MSDLSLLISYLRIEVAQESGRIILNQMSYALMILD